MKTWWPYARALLITLAMVVGLADGCPVPEKKMRDRMSPGLAQAIDTIDKVRVTFLRPFRPIGATAKLYQKWSLFRGASRSRFRLWVEARTDGGEWELLYRAQDDEHDFLGDQLAYRRVRGAYNPSNRRGTPNAYSAFVTWIANQVFAARPDVVEVRVQDEQLKITDEDGAIGQGTFTYVQTRRRGSPK
jgi:hypothetical protein